MTLSVAAALLTPPALLAIVVGCILLKRTLARPKLLPEEFALAGAWVFVVGGLVWLGAFLSDSTFLGFSSPWTWLAAAHFAAAGFGSLTITALCCRVVSSRKALKVLRILLMMHPIAYLIIAAGITGLRYCDELGATMYAFIFATQLAAVAFSRTSLLAGFPRILIFVALSVPVVTMIPALAWAWGVPIFDMTRMVKYHGIINAIGHVGLGFAVFAWVQPPSHSIIRKGVDAYP